MGNTGPPPHVELLRSFANTIDYDTDTDALIDPQALSDWLREKGLIEVSSAAGAGDLAAARQLRDGLRECMAGHHDRAGVTPIGLEAAAAPFTLRLTFDGGSPRLVPVGGGPRAALGLLLVAMTDAVADGTWSRLKICRAENCRWAFYDVSKNRSRTWCAMGVCGNRQKTRNYRARRRGR